MGAHRPCSRRPCTGSMRRSPDLRAFSEAIGPAALEVDMLCVSYQERSIEVREAERYDEFRIADAPAHCVGYLNLIPDTLLSYAMFRADKQDLACLVAERVLQQTLPVLAAAQSEHVCPDFVPGRGQSRPEPDGKFIVLGIGMADEDGVPSERGHVAGLQPQSDVQRPGVRWPSMAARAAGMMKSPTSRMTVRKSGSSMSSGSRARNDRH